MTTVLVVLQILVALTLIGVVLVQHGKGADMGASFGGGSSQTLFGARGSATFLSRLTAVLATLFFATSLGLAYLSARPQSVPSPIRLEQPAAPVAPAHQAAPPSSVPGIPDQKAP
ncbi:preprotein translocase subunit SecG [Acidiferrobacter sp.]|jgi:preprotein translocase subunit SecG|uniref:preprotein translocase subunit SecG n=1 Tax=Acidiferrobacter sp. TaxID=1872107 RepID=UPI0026310708|nr:preprotein translocase subunit SecG [Acidiferrobacter sp.]